MLRLILFDSRTAHAGSIRHGFKIFGVKHAQCMSNCKMFKASRLSSPLMEWSGRAPAAPVRWWDEASLKRSTTMSNKSTAMG